MGSIATRWRVLSGENEWEGLLDPLNIDLRRYIIHYGERGIGDAFIYEKKSSNRGLPRYAKKHLFSKVGLEIGNPYKYVVNKYLYAATKKLPGKSIFLGFVAVTTDEGKQVLGRRDILISWRGTMLDDVETEIDVSDFSLVSASDIFGQDNVNKPKVHSGWHAYYTGVDPHSPYNKTASCRAQVLAAVRELVDKYQNEEMSLTVSGHSMGAAIATLNATDIVYNGHNKPTNEADKACMVTAIVLASPRLGDTGFGTLFSSLQNLYVLRVTNEGDPVPNTPKPIPIILEYVHVGKELKIDTLESPYLKDPSDFETSLKWGFFHNLEVYLHGVAGPREPAQNGDIVMEVNRDIALVNKALDGVKDEYRVVANWWTEKNKSMVQGDDGHWVLMDHEKDDDDELA